MRERGEKKKKKRYIKRKRREREREKKKVFVIDPLLLGTKKENLTLRGVAPLVRL
jgi:hypothetical protein